MARLDYENMINDGEPWTILQAAIIERAKEDYKDAIMLVVKLQKLVDSIKEGAEIKEKSRLYQRYIKEFCEDEPSRTEYIKFLNRELRLAKSDVTRQRKWFTDSEWGQQLTEGWGYKIVQEIEQEVLETGKAKKNHVHHASPRKEETK